LRARFGADSSLEALFFKFTEVATGPELAAISAIKE
jgi:hypothetical protein